MVKGPPAASDSGSKGCVNLPSPTAVFRLNLETAVREGKVSQDFDSESLAAGGSHSQMVKGTPAASDSGSKGCVNLPSPTAVSRFMGAWTSM